MRISDWSPDVCSSDLLAWHQPHVIRHVVVIGDDHAALRIDRDAAPVRAAVVTRIFDRMPRRFRRRIDALIARPTELDAACELIDRQSVVDGKRESVRVALGVRLTLKKKYKNNQ